MQFGKRIGPLARRVAAMQIPVYAGNASFFLLLSVFPVVSLLLSLLPYTPLTLDHLLAFCEEFAPDWTLRALEFFVRTLYASSSAAIISASAVLTLWSASKGMLSLLYGLDAVAEVRETRGYVQRRLLCVLYTVGMLLALLLTLVMCVGMIPTAFAAQQNSYHDPAEHWMQASGRCRRAGAAAVSDGARLFPRGGARACAAASASGVAGVADGAVHGHFSGPAG